MTEDEMFGWHHQHNGHEFEQSPGDSGEQGSLACCSPWGHKESDMTEQLNDNPLTGLSRQWLDPECELQVAASQEVNLGKWLTLLDSG